MTSKNLYHRRAVAETAAKACWICYKPSSTVLITPEQEDWFHICLSHLNDKKFAIAQDEADIAERKRREELDREIEAVKKEYEEKMRKKAAGKNKDKEKEKDKSGDDKKSKDEKEDKDEKEKDAKLKELEQKKNPTTATADDGPRIFELQRNFYQARLQKKREAELAKRNRERLRNPTFFPSVPSGEPA